MESPLRGSETPGSEIKRPRDPTQAKDVFQRKWPLDFNRDPGIQKKKEKIEQLQSQLSAGTGPSLHEVLTETPGSRRNKNIPPLTSTTHFQAQRSRHLLQLQSELTPGTVPNAYAKCIVLFSQRSRFALQPQSELTPRATTTAGTASLKRPCDIVTCNCGT